MSARRFHRPGEDIGCTREAVYLGGPLTCDGRALREVVRRIGEAGSVFRKLQEVWKHAGVTRTQRLMSCVVSKLMYSLVSMWLLQSERERLNAFHHRCLRRILHIDCTIIFLTCHKRRRASTVGSATVDNCTFAASNCIVQTHTEHVPRQLCATSSLHTVRRAQTVERTQMPRTS